MWRHLDLFYGGSAQNRTADTWIFSPLLYQLSLPSRMAVRTGIEPAISSVTDRHINYYTTGPLVAGEDLNFRSGL